MVYQKVLVECIKSFFCGITRSIKHVHILNSFYKNKTLILITWHRVVRDNYNLLILTLFLNLVLSWFQRIIHRWIIFSAQPQTLLEKFDVSTVEETSKRILTIVMKLYNLWNYLHNYSSVRFPCDMC